MLNVVTFGDYNFLNYLNIRFIQIDGYAENLADSLKYYPLARPCNETEFEMYGITKAV